VSQERGVFHAKPRSERSHDASQAFGAIAIRLEFKHETPPLYCIERGQGRVKKPVSSLKNKDHHDTMGIDYKRIALDGFVISSINIKPTIPYG